MNDQVSILYERLNKTFYSGFRMVHMFDFYQIEYLNDTPEGYIKERIYLLLKYGFKVSTGYLDKDKPQKVLFFKKGKRVKDGRV